jgi:hypothetical protein
MRRLLALLGVCAAATPAAATAQLFVDVEGGVALLGRNDVRIPNDGGTDFSFVDDLDADPAPSLRLRFGWDITPRHHLSALIAPLSFSAAGTFDRPVTFEDVTFPADAPVEGTYKFNSYRITYRFTPIRSSRIRFGFGGTVKIRDARVALASEADSADSTDLGVVPLLNLEFAWRFAGCTSLLLNVDGAWAPQGRAEDVLLAVEHAPSDAVALRVGYRLLEGGADVDQVYNFALVHYATLGVTLRF